MTAQPRDHARLPDPKQSFAVLIGTGRYSSAELDDLPAVDRNLTALFDVLTDPVLGWLPAERCIVRLDLPDARSAYRVLREYSRAAKDTLLVYFAGHCRTGPSDELYLCLADTEPDELPVSALSFELVREILRDCAAGNRVMILDWCFADRAVPTDDFGARVLSRIDVAGTYTLASAPVGVSVNAPVGADHTAFTGELLRVLQDGLPGGPALLTLGDIDGRLRQRMRQHGLPLPVQRNFAKTARFAMTRNAVVRPLPPGSRATPARTGRTTASSGSTAGPQASSRPGVSPANGPTHQRTASIGWVILAILVIVGTITLFDVTLLARKDETFPGFALQGDAAKGTLSFVFGALAGLASGAGVGVLLSPLPGFDGRVVPFGRLVVVDLVVSIALILGATLSTPARAGVLSALFMAGILVVVLVYAIVAQLMSYMDSKSWLGPAFKRLSAVIDRHRWQLLAAVTLGAALGSGAGISLAIGLGKAGVGLGVGLGAVLGLCGVVVALQGRIGAMLRGGR